jgi:hypothetical protein
LRITWDGDNRPYSEGVSQGVLYPENSPGVAWNGLISVTEKGDDSSSALYLDGQIYRNRNVPSNFSGTIVAYMYPDDFDIYNGVYLGRTGQPRPSFGLCYRSNEELHIVYGAVAAPSNDKYSSIGAEISPVSFSWDFTTVPVKIPGGKPSAHIVILLDQILPGVLTALETVLYGDDSTVPSIPSPDDLIELFESHSILRITDNGDGTWTATGPDTVITMIDSDTFDINWPSAVFIDASTYTVSSL